MALHSQPVDGYMDRFITGTLEVVNGCVVIKTSQEAVTPIFSPGDVAWDGANLTLLLTGRVLQLGTQVRLSGGPASTKKDKLPAGCPPTAWAAGPS